MGNEILFLRPQFETLKVSTPLKCYFVIDILLVTGLNRLLLFNTEKNMVYGKK